MERVLIELLDNGSRLELERDALVGEQHEVLDEDGSRLFQRLLRMDGTIGGDVERQFLIVGLLLDTIVGDLVLHVLYRRVDGVDSDDTNGVIAFLVLLGGDIATTFLDIEFYLQTGGGLHVADLHVGIENLETVEILVQLLGLEDIGTGNGEGYLLRVDVLNLATETNLLQAKYDVGHILYHTRQVGKLVVDTVNLHRCDGKSLERGEKDTAKGVAYCDTIARFQRTELKGATIVVGFKQDDLVRFLKSQYCHIIPFSF